MSLAASALPTARSTMSTDIDTKANSNGRAAAQPSPEVAAAMVATFTEGWRDPKGPEQFVAALSGMLAPDVVLIQPQMRPTVGLEAFEHGFVRPLFSLIDGVRGEVERWAARGDTVYIELTLRGTVGRRPISVRVCDRARLRADGRVAERETYLDPSPLLGAVARSPRAWPRFLSLRSRRLARLLERTPQ